jgi:hypothetical protein
MKNWSITSATAFHLSTLLDEVLRNPVYLSNARKLQQAMAKTDGLFSSSGPTGRSVHTQH